jgi:hypothetical protein
MTKREVCEYLGKSKRTIETYIGDCRLPCEYVSGPNGKQLSFKREDVERMKRDIETPTPRTVHATQAEQASEFHQGNLHLRKASQAIAPAAVDIAAMLDELAARMTKTLAPAAPMKPWLDLKAAADYSGLPAAYLVQAARDGSIRAVNVGTGAKAFWRFNREALAK